MSSILLKQIATDIELDELLSRQRLLNLIDFRRAMQAVRLCFSGCDGLTREQLVEKIIDALVVSNNVFDQDVWPEYLQKLQDNKNEY